VNDKYRLDKRNIELHMQIEAVKVDLMFAKILYVYTKTQLNIYNI
jgi:hypothetical protein